MSKKKIQLNIKADDLKKKLNIKDGYTPIKGKDYFDGETPIIDTQDIVTRASKLAQVELEKKIVPPAPFKITDQEIEDISLDVQSQIEPKFEELKKEIEETKIKAGQRINTGFKAFRNLTDAPHSYNRQSGKLVHVKENETGLDFSGDILSTNLSLSSGIIEGGALSIGTPTSTFSISDGNGVIVDAYTDPQNPVIHEVTWTGLTNQTVTNIATETITYVFITTAGTVFQTNVEPTDAQHRDYIFLGQLAHTNFTSVTNVISTPDIMASPVNQLRDLEKAVGIINDGNSVYANGANLFLNKTAGILYMNGINFHNNNKIPSEKAFASATNISWRYRTRTGAGATVSSIDPNNYDLNGTITALIGTQATNQRVYLTITGNIVIQYGQTVHASLVDAISGLASESFIVYPNLETASLIGVIAVERNTTSLQNTSKARFLAVSKFGEVTGSAAGISVSTLQNAYNNSTTPEILTDATRGALSIKRGSGADTDNVIEVLNGAGTEKVSVKGDGTIEAVRANVANSVTITVPDVTAVTPTQISGTWLTYSAGYTQTYYPYYYITPSNRYHFAVVAYKMYEGNQVFSSNLYEFYVDVTNALTPVDVNVSITPVAGADGYWFFYGGTTDSSITSVDYTSSNGTEYTSTNFTLSDYPSGVSYFQMALFSGAVLPATALQISGIVQFDDVLKWKYGSNSLLKTDATNFFFGENGGNQLGSGIFNTTYGKDAGTVIDNATTNVLIGYNAGKILYSSANVIIGALSGALITSGAQNIALGANSLVKCTTGNRNISIGLSSLENVTTGFGNTAIGASSGAYVRDVNNHWSIGTQVTSYDWTSTVGLFNLNNFFYARGLEIATGLSNSKPVTDLSIGFGLMPHAQTENYFRGGAMFGSKTGLGSEKITNSTADASTGWTLGTGWANTSGVFVFSGATAGTLSQTSANMVTPLVVGKMYYLNIIGGYNPNISSGSLTQNKGVDISVGGVNLGHITSTGSYIFVATSTADLVITPVANHQVIIDSISLKEVTQGDIVTAGNIQALGNFKSSDGSTGFTGTGAYTNFTIKNGIITNAT